MADLIALRSGDCLVELNFAGLSAGSYQLVIDGVDVTDRAGNPLAAGNVVTNFTLTGDAIDNQGVWSAIDTGKFTISGVITTCYGIV